MNTPHKKLTVGEEFKRCITLNGRFCSSQPEESTNELLASIRDELRQQR